VNFSEKLKASIQATQSVLCVGLDPVYERIPSFICEKFGDTPESIFEFCKIVIEESSSYTAAYKPNLAFFEAYGSDGIKVFEQILSIIPADKIIIADAKRGDIGNTAARYRDAFFSRWKCDSVTLSPLMGYETITPFMTDERFGAYVLTLTSNPGSSNFMLKPFDGFATMSEYIASSLAELTDKFPGHGGMVVGATRTADFKSILKLHPKANLLIPGVGAQGGDILELSNALKGHHGIPLINVSRGIIYGSDTDTLSESHVRDGIRNRTISFHKELTPIFKQLFF
jgi:orotidine-5'-phosphate decarboxylase